MNMDIRLTHKNREYGKFKNQYKDYNFIISKSGDLCLVDGSRKNVEQIDQFFENNKNDFIALDFFKLPDSSIATIYKNQFSL